MCEILSYNYKESLPSKARFTEMSMMRIMNSIPFLQAIVNEELQNLPQGLVILRLLKEGGVGRIMKNDEGTNQRKGQEDDGSPVPSAQMKQS